MVALSAEGMVDAVIHRLHLAEGCVGGDGLPILTAITFNTAIHACNQAKQVRKYQSFSEQCLSLHFSLFTRC